MTKSDEQSDAQRKCKSGQHASTPANEDPQETTSMKQSDAKRVNRGLHLYST